MDNDVVTAIPPSDASTPILEAWLEDLLWHRGVYRQSKLRWRQEEPVLIATEFTRGRHDYTTVADLHTLSRSAMHAAGLAGDCQRALGLALTQVRMTGPMLRTWDTLAELLDLEPHQCAQAVQLSTWSDGQRAIPTPVRSVLQMCEAFLFANPLLTAWELKQLWTLYDAGAEILEDTVVDLLVELSPTVPGVVLANACGMSTRAAIDDRIARQRSARGDIGDPRRQVRQTFRPIPRTAPHSHTV